MAGEYLMANLKRAEVRRQAVLDWLNQHPGARMAEIEDALPQFERLHLRGSVASMVRLREITAEGKLKLRRFIASATVTTSAEAVLDGKRLNTLKAYCRRTGKTLDQVRGRESQEAKAARAAGKRRAKEAERADESEARVQSIEPGRTRYLCGHTKPAQGSRGQGCVRERNTINCHQLYLGSSAMKTATLPGIIKQRWTAAAQNPSIQQWRSLAVWIDDFANACAKHVETEHLVDGMRRMSAEAWENMRSLQPVRELEVAA